MSDITHALICIFFFFVWLIICYLLGEYIDKKHYKVLHHGSGMSNKFSEMSDNEPLTVGGLVAWALFWGGYLGFTILLSRFK